MNSALYWIETYWTGKLAILARPRGGAWLDDDVQAWRRAGVDVVASLLTTEEVAELDLAQEQEVCQVHEIEFLSFPISDRGVPDSRKAAVDFLRGLAESLEQGKRIGIHCRQGIGRSGLIAASLLVMSGIAPDLVFRRISAARGCSVPETPEQSAWVAEFARALTTLLHQAPA